MKPGLSYQEEAATFFRSLGLSAEVEKKGLEGVRGKHDIDVWVTGRIHAFDVRWVVECKDWSTNVPKEKVLALISVVQDVGADRGWLLSEKGFQTGAVHCAHLSNVTLTSLEYLRKETKEYISESSIMTLLSRVVMLKAAYQRFWHDYEDLHGDYSFAMSHKGFANCVRQMYLDSAIIEALVGDFPVIYAVREHQGMKERREAKNMEDLIDKVSALVREDEHQLIQFRQDLEDDRNRRVNRQL